MPSNCDRGHDPPPVNRLLTCERSHTDRPHIQHLLASTKLLAQEPTLFVPPSSTASVTNALKSGSAASANKALKTPKKHVKAAPTPESLATVMLHDLLFAKRGLTLPKEHKMAKKLEKYRPA
ncbi:hypothetical protein DMC30DRAFT_23937 [Rhodotorula diobovata]|uniref:Uncharacterized protein n=1 Tax=Rhodotorula diobovata TaxID=5288 RepID=A0A5C5FQI4_9BASI|nr:hypothetical protein DMC30DRAFT_23937 [Rhodotorula diobovata]